MKWLHLCVFMVVQLSFMVGQDPDGIEIRQLEDIIELGENQSGFAYDNLLENIDYFTENPLDINTVTVEDLLAIGILSEPQAQAIVRQRDLTGDYIAIYELQAVPGIPLQLARYLSQVLKVGNGSNAITPSVIERITDGDNQLFLRWTRTVEDQKGFIPDDTGKTPFEGDPNKLYMRYRHRYSNTLSYGMTAEKDEGESFFRESNPQGFDFYSAHLWWKSDGKIIKQVALGDFAVSYGEGLVIHSDFGYGKSGAVRDIKKNFRKMRPYTSLSESNFLRGAAVQIQASKNVEINLFGSYRRQDGNLLVRDSLDREQDVFTSIQNSGFHRTESEIADEASIDFTTAGGHVEYTFGRGNIGITGLYNRFNPSLQPNPALFRFHTFAGEQLLNYSMNYAFFYGSTHFFGEVAKAEPGGIAMVHGLMSSLSQEVDLGIFYRNYQKDYNSFWANGIGEVSNTNNEEGIYMGIEYRPSYGWHFQAFADVWKHEWLRFRVDAPSTGREYLVRAAYKKRKKYEVYVRFRTESRFRTENLAENKIDPILPTHRTQFRVNVDYNITPSLRLRNRVEFSWWEIETVEKESGVLIFQDIMYKPVGSPFSLTARYALFDTDDWDSRIYAFENNLIYNFSIPPYAGQGRRYYLNLRYKATRNLTIEGRFSQWKYRDRDVISSGVLEIAGDTRTELKAQLRYTF